MHFKLISFLKRVLFESDISEFLSYLPSGNTKPSLQATLHPLIEHFIFESAGSLGILSQKPEMKKIIEKVS